ncbi:MAG TPA: outer membrane beta-barrel protein [Caulobacteraceae bacterium]
MASGHGGAKAQDLGPFARPNVSVLNRPHPEYDAAGIPQGAFTAFPKLQTTFQYESNIFADQSDTSDTVWIVAPSVEIQSDWPRHQLTLSAGFEADRYNSHAILDTNSWNVALAGRLDVLRSATLNLSGGYSRQVESKTSPNTQPGTSSPVTYDLGEAHVTGAYLGARTKLSGHLDFMDWRFDAARTDLGSIIPEDQRNHTQTSATGRADYAFSPNIAVFVEASADQRRYQQKPPLVLLDRDSNGESVLVGSSFQITHVIDGEVGVGYLRRGYDDPTAKTFSGVGARADVNWYVTPLITATLGAARSVEDSGLPNVAGYVDNAVSVRADYELLRNLILTAQFRDASDRYVGIDRHDHRPFVALRGSWLLNRRVGLGASYSHQEQHSDGPQRGVNFTDDKVGINLVLQY